MKILALSCANFVKFLPCPACKFRPSIIATFSTQLRGWVVGSKSTKMYNFACPWVRIPVRTENMSVIFFCADFFSFSYLKSASDSFRGVHKQYGPGRERRRHFYPIYLVTWFIVRYTVMDRWCTTDQYLRFQSFGHKKGCSFLSNDTESRGFDTYNLNLCTSILMHKKQSI